jgi:glycosyltransferase involved in cell wall biosynthesis
VIPALNEEKAISLVLRDLPPRLFARVVVVDNGSTDRTAEVARAAGVEVVHESRRGYGSACMAGIRTLLHSGSALAEDDWIAFLDADYSDDPSDLSRVLEPLHRGSADFVLGSRVLGGAGPRALLPQARVGNWIACSLMRICFGARHTDLGPMRALSVRHLVRMRMRDLDYGWTIEMQLKAAHLRLRVLEVPVRYRQRIGKSKVTGTLSGSLRAGTKILGWICGYRVRLWLVPKQPDTA